ncbi:MAG: hypothetical protein KatS3mg115_0989 [Candidatus Poribacteria bacterium]|nr:MAG: hypothetical protein KatS3mg115_0989 [Candidatus Poribacteria bacterium]
MNTSDDGFRNEPTLHPPERWAALAERLLERGRIVLLLGGVDAGKSTLARFLAQRALDRGWTVGYLDADLGQSTVGPPTTVALKRLRRSLEELREPPDAMIFLGAISPVYCRTEVVVAVRRLADYARRRVDLLVVDTSGMIAGPGAYTLKTQKIECLRPHHVVALIQPATREPIEELLRPFRRRADLKLHVLEALPETGIKSPAYRRDYRNARFEDYFAKARPVRLWLHSRTVLGRGLLRERFGEEIPSGLLIGLNDRYGWTVGLGVLRRSPSRNQEFLEIETPVRSLRGVVAVQLSPFRLAPEASPGPSATEDEAAASESPPPRPSAGAETAPAQPDCSAPREVEDSDPARGQSAARPTPRYSTRPDEGDNSRS